MTAGEIRKKCAEYLRLATAGSPENNGLCAQVMQGAMLAEVAAQLAEKNEVERRKATPRFVLVGDGVVVDANRVYAVSLGTHNHNDCIYLRMIDVEQSIVLTFDKTNPQKAVAEVLEALK